MFGLALHEGWLAVIGLRTPWKEPGAVMVEERAPSHPNAAVCAAREAAIHSR